MKKVLVLLMLVLLSGCSVQKEFNETDFFVYHSDYDIYLQYYNQDKLINITENIEGDFVTPVVSSDGKYVAFVSKTKEPYRLYLYDVEQNKTSIIVDNDGNNFTNINFTHPSNDLLYVRNNIVYKYNIEKKVTRVLYDLSQYPDNLILRALYDDENEQLYLSVMLDNSFDTIYVYDLNQKKLSVFFQNGYNMLISDFDDNNMLVTTYSTNKQIKNQVGILDMTNGDFRTVTSNKHNSENPKFIKDNQFIIYQSDDNKNKVYQIYVMTAKGTKQTEITDLDLDAYFPGGN